MAEIGFYHLTRTRVEAALPPLLSRTLAAGKRAVVLCGPARLAALDQALWEVSDWLPHGTAADGHADLQPIWLTATPDAPNGANFLFLLDGAALAALPGLDRVFDLFDGTDAACVAAARARWSHAKRSGNNLTYWRQGDKGWTQGETK